MRPTPPPEHWLLQDAKARFSELVRRLQGGRTGQALVDVLQASPYRDVELALAPSVAASVRDLEL